MSPPQISVLIPVWNGVDQIGLCLDALAVQSLPRDQFEVVVVDNGSTDRTAEVVGRYPFVRLLTEPGPGSYRARNAGLPHLKGDYVAFTDADCIPDRDWLRNGLAALHANPGAGIIVGRVELFRTSADGSDTCVEFDRIFNLNQKRYAALGHSATANWISPLRVVLDRGGFNGDLKSSGDFELSGRIRSAGYTLVYAPDVLVKHPSRGSIVELVNKRRRITGGQWVLAKGSSPLRFAYGIIRKWRESMGRAVREGPDATWMRMKVMGLVTLLTLAALAEFFRLLLGGTPRRA
jgi:glycosyltransferase involved in cell wall biosynthesis